MPFRGEVFHVYRKEESKAKEADDDQVDQPDADGRRGDWWAKGPEIVNAELDTWRDGLRRGDHVHFCNRDVILEEVGDPRPAEVGYNVLLYNCHAGYDVR